MWRPLFFLVLVLASPLLPPHEGGGRGMPRGVLSPLPLRSLLFPTHPPWENRDSTSLRVRCRDSRRSMDASDLLGYPPFAPLSVFCSAIRLLLRYPSFAPLSVFCSTIRLLLRYPSFAPLSVFCSASLLLAPLLFPVSGWAQCGSPDIDGSRIFVPNPCSLNPPPRCVFNVT